MVEGEGDGHTAVGTQMVEGEGDAQVSDVAKELQHVMEAEVHDVEEVKAHDVYNFELEDVEEDEDVREGEDEDLDEGDEGDVHDDEDVDEDAHELDEDVDDDVDDDEESLVDVSIQCNIGTSKGNWLSDELVSGPDSEKEDDSIKIGFPTFSMPKSLEEYKWEVMDIKDKFTRKRNVGISRNMAFRARTIAKDNVEGSFKEQFRQFQACKDSFMCCRPIIGLDGCFLKGKYGGELLTTIGRDGNEQILPIAYAVIEVENKDSWTWFLELLIEDLAIQDLLPGVEQRYCVKHLYSKFRKKYSGKYLKRLMWRAATTTYPQQWESEMRKIKEVNLEAFKYLIVIPPRFWSRSRFTPRSQSDTLVNNMCEGFNSVLLRIRFKPIITILEDIRVYIMKRWATNRTKMASNQGSICPKITPYVDVLPPKKRTIPGRSKKKQRLEAWELKKNDRKNVVSANKLGHNKNSCPQRPPTTEQCTEQPNVPLTQESIVLPTNQSTQQIEVTIAPPTNVPITHQSTVLLFYQ
ncbi:hypothetical protein V8G54_029641 [Vigna mungo]|uniref:MULE transposase domain-containing protein n=1 Tax=Vigna mungo TaxID=3915 RepID=A0AAQ3MUN0_VIGMU